MKTQSYTAGGLSSGTASGVVQMTVSSRAASKSKAFSRTERTVKKKLNYNPKEMATALTRASKSQSAGRVAVQAKSKLSTLMRCKGTGEYNEAEINNAIIHAKRLVECAQMKVRNLREEERMQKKYQQEVKSEAQQERNEVKGRVARQERMRDQKEGIERLQVVEKEKSRQREIVQKRRIHRNQEQGKMNEAEMEYLKEQVRSLKGEPGAVYQGPVQIPIDNITVELSDNGVKLSDAQLEQQAEAAMVSMGGAAAMPAPSSMPAVSASSSVPVSVAASVDVVV